MSKSEKTGDYAEFQGVIDRSLEKANPDKSVPWPPTPAPPWALGYSPRRIIDIGCAAADYTAAVILRLGQWGCLVKFEDLLLVERETGLGALAERHCREALSSVAARAPRIETLNATVDIAGGVLCADGVALPPAGLIIASHVTYFFGLRGAEDLIEAMLKNVVGEEGLAWVVIRKRASPIYEARIKALADQGVPDDSPTDYSEPLEAALESGDVRAKVLDARDCAFLDGTTDKAERARLASLLMWRTPSVDAVAEGLTAMDEPLFLERHFILSVR